MGAWPKTVYIRGIGIPVESWEELDELIQRYGAEGPIVIQHAVESGVAQASKRGGRPVQLSHTDRSLLSQFVEGGDRGVPTSQIGLVLGKRGKGIGRALEAWGRRIGLVPEEGASAFEATKTARGRGFRLAGIYLQVARSMLGT